MRGDELEGAAHTFLCALELAQNTGAEIRLTPVMWEGVEAIKGSLQELAGRYGSEKAKELALSALDLERIRFREALEGVRQALYEAGRLTAGAEFSCGDAARAVDLLEKAVHRVRCAVNGMREF
ncbi:hypothetical protein [Desulfofundulus thermosubterraneus]|uniref:Uncharacterized protein n=1 Tax=Desulfofundulus thermosubterraneus DSM 16057 TaxID=1121432 RepID=A0A1M6JER2_9FIRM|nr:hypothetical protein [Desulfofundulus thermosubterraneus]SHJ45144.1 hypothetical protein SAMN02745219_02590 [Desulfofundulus thermosubterraneus DSM 16057]